MQFNARQSGTLQPARAAAILFVCLASLTVPAWRMVAAADGSPDRAPTQQVLVLITGRVIEGQITPRPDGYDVQLDAGRLFISSDRVRFQASDLPEAYRKLRASLPELTPNRHVELARWCQLNNLHEEARRELLDALAMDPNRMEAKRLLLEVLRQQQADSGAAIAGAADSAGNGAASMQSAISAVEQPIQSRSLGGLSKANAREFVDHVQPIIVNKCSGGGCHMPTHSGFAVFSTRRGTTPLISERNLASVLNHVDLSNPQQSRLLMAGTESHGGSNSPVFRGRAGNAQLQVLLNWVSAVTEDLGPANAVDSNRGKPSSQLLGMLDNSGRDQIRQVAANDTSFENADTHHAILDNTANDNTGLRMSQGTAIPHGSQISTTAMDQKILADVKQLDRKDPFDPQIFNQRYHQSAAARRPAGNLQN